VFLTDVRLDFFGEVLAGIAVDGEHDVRLDDVAALGVGFRNDRSLRHRGVFTQRGLTLHTDGISHVAQNTLG